MLVPSAVPEDVICPMEFLCVIGFLLPAFGIRYNAFAAAAAIVIALEMLAFCGVHFVSGTTSYGPVVYWLVVAAICAFVAVRRMAFK